MIGPPPTRWCRRCWTEGAEKPSAAAAAFRLSAVEAVEQARGHPRAGDMRGTADDVGMAIGDRIEGAGIDPDAAAHLVSPSPLPSGAASPGGVPGSPRLSGPRLSGPWPSGPWPLEQSPLDPSPFSSATS